MLDLNYAKRHRALWQNTFNPNVYAIVEVGPDGRPLPSGERCGMETVRRRHAVGRGLHLALVRHEASLMLCKLLEHYQPANPFDFAGAWFEPRVEGMN